MVIKVGINGFGRIGRVIFRTCLQRPEIELSAINDPAIDIDYICYLIKFDSTHGKFKGNVTNTENEIKIDGRTIKVFREKLPSNIPWQTAGVQYIIEASGMFTSLDKASCHLADDGVKRVIVTAPSVDVPMIIMGVNDNKLNADQKVLSCASSTLYCLAPIIKVLEESFGMTEGFITSIHAMTPSLKPLDGLCLRGKHWRDHRSIHQNIIPASTGACKALAKIIPQVKDKMSGLAFRVPIVNVSVLDLTIRLDKNTSIQEIFKAVETASKSYLKNIIKISHDEAVSSDFIGDSHSCILDADSSLELRPNFYKIICWYENEYSYACRVLDSIFFSEKQLNKLVRLPCKMTYVRAKLSMKKQDEVQQTERNNKEKSIECNSNTEVPKTPCSTSQETGFKRKQLTRPLLLRKPMSSHNGAAASPSASIRDTKKRNELFKIWNDNNDVQKNLARQNRSSFFHSCIAFGPKKSEKSDCMKAQERLENVKKEFSKMVNITEDLLKKSYINKFQLKNSVESSKEEVKVDLNGGLINKQSDEMNTTNNTKVPVNNPIFEVCGDFKNSVLTSLANGCSKEEVTFCSSSERNENNSDYNIKDEAKTILDRKMSCTKMSQEENYIKNKTTTNSNQNSAARNSFMAWANESSKRKISPKTNELFERGIHEQVAKTVDSLINKSNAVPSGIQIQFAMNDHKRIVAKLSEDFSEKVDSVQDNVFEIDIIEKSGKSKITIEKIGCYTETSKSNINEESEPSDEFNKYLQNKDYNIHVIDEELKKRNIVLVDNQKEVDSEEISFKTSSIDIEPLTVTTDEQRRNLNRVVPEPVVIIAEDNSGRCSPGDTVTTISNGDGKRRKPDIYDKLDSASASDSNNSFEINERKSQVIHITDLTNSLEDLARLDKICRIIEISDELSDKLFSTLDQSEITAAEQKKWSFKDLCQRLQLDEFCNKVFGKSTV